MDALFSPLLSLFASPSGSLASLFAAAFIAATQARHVVFCTGRHNTFGFPDASVVKGWRGAGAAVWNTAVHGEVSFWVDGDDVKVRAFH